MFLAYIIYVGGQFQKFLEMGYMLEPCDSASCQLGSILNHLRNGPLGRPM